MCIPKLYINQHPNSTLVKVSLQLITRWEGTAKERQEAWGEAGGDRRESGGRGRGGRGNESCWTLEMVQRL